VADCILEQIAKAVTAKLEDLVTAGTAADVQRPLRPGIPDRLQHTSLVLYQDDPTEDQSPHRFKQWIQPFIIECYIRPSDDSTTPVEETINNLRAEVEKKLLEDPSFGGLAVDTRIRAPRLFQLDEGFEGIAVRADVIYRTIETDPFSQT